MENNVQWDPDFERIANHIDATDMDNVVSMYSPGDTKFVVYKNTNPSRKTFEDIVTTAVEEAPSDDHVVAFGEVDSTFGDYQAVIRLDPAVVQVDTIDE